jgi:ParB family chromosome partitioning protein
VTKNQNVEQQPQSGEQDAELAWVDPRTVVFGPNVRADAAATLTPEFIESVREKGIIERPTYERMPDGTLQPKHGHRRTLAAIEAGLPLIQAVIVPANGDKADRLIEQFHENDQRAGITDADRTAGIQQLALFGVPSAKIAKETKIPKKTVETALKVAASEKARAAQVEHNLTIPQSAGVLEFQEDPAAVDRLTEVATTDPGQFDHTLQRLRHEREQAAAMAEARQALAKAGTREITDWWSEVDDSSKAAPLYALMTPEGRSIKSDDHATCPGHAVRLEQYDDTKVHTSAACMDYKANGHVTSISTGSKPSVKDLPPAEREAARVERRRVIEGNKGWKPETEVRRKWLAENFAPRKTAPKGAQAFIAASLMKDVYDIRKADDGGVKLAAELLGIKTTGYNARSAILDMIDKAPTPGRALHIGLVVILAALEENTSKDTWRGTLKARYFLALQDWGYNLGPVEREAAGLAPAEPAPAEGTLAAA